MNDDTIKPGTKPKLKRPELIDAANQLSVMLGAAVPLGDALSCVTQQQTNDSAKLVWQEVEEEVVAGTDFSAVLERRPQFFPRLFIALVAASEKSGMLPQLLKRATAYLEDEQEIVRKVRGAMTYPGIMFAFACSTSLFLLAVVLPRFAKIYAGKGAALPTPTKILMASSDFVVANWLMLLIGTLVAAAGSWFYLKTDDGQRLWHTAQLRLPLVGGMFRTLHLARGLRTIGTLTAAGVTLLEAVEAAAGVTANGRFRVLWDDAAEGLRQGESLSRMLGERPDLVPGPVVQMVKSGEKSGKLGEVMEHVSVHAEAKLKEQIAQATRYIEPAMIVVMGALIGGVTLAMLLPVFTISRVVAS